MLYTTLQILQRGHKILSISINPVKDIMLILSSAIRKHLRTLQKSFSTKFINVSNFMDGIKDDKDISKDLAASHH